MTGSSQAPQAAGLPGLSGTERLLWERVERGLRHQSGGSVLVLHLSRLSAPAPRPHHRRVAGVLLQDTASRYGGQVFAMRNQDLVLLIPHAHRQTGGPSGESGAAASVHAPEVLPATMAQLFAADVPDPARLTSHWRLETEAGTLLAYLEDCAAAQPAREAGQLHNKVPGLIALQSALDHAPLDRLIVLRVGMRLSPDRWRSLAERLTPAFLRVELSLSALNMDALWVQAAADPFLAAYLTEELGRRLIAVLSRDLMRGGRVTRAAARQRVPIHLSIGLQDALSAGFASLLRDGAACGIRFGVAISPMQASAGEGLLADLADALAASGGSIVLTGVQNSLTALVKPAGLWPGLVEWHWSSGLPAAFDLAGFDPARTILSGADTQAALAWGQAQGVSLYEGTLLDQVQAAVRMGVCSHAGGCTLQHCIGRARAAGRWGNDGCGNAALLERGWVGAQGAEASA